jgi:hypothetical protein
MMRKLLKAGLGLAALMAVGIISSSGPAYAINIGTLTVGTPFADVIQSGSGPFSRQYDFHLSSPNTQVTLLASAQAQTSDHFKVDALTISLFDSASNLLATASGVPVADFDSFEETGTSLVSGDYFVRVVGNAPPTFRAFVKVSLAANDFVQGAVPIPGAVLMLLTALGGLGGIGAIRRYFPGGQSKDLAI